jgi:hypothetical protein
LQGLVNKVKPAAATIFHQTIWQTCGSNQNPMRFIIVLLIGYIFFRYVLPGLLRLLGVWVIRKAAQQQQEQFGGQGRQGNPFQNPYQNSYTGTGPRQQRPVRPEGTIIVEQQPASPKKPAGDEPGEYVDFEEVK